jgi:tRNA A-37 threonylcarbamoyl transferase component Bud32
MEQKTNYKIKGKIGEGGMATVFLAHDVALNRDVAIKVLRVDPRLKLSEESKNEIILRFQQEAQAAARLNHPNIVSIYHVGRRRNQHFIVMEYLRGKSLAQMMQASPRFPLSILLKYTIQVCIALDFAHQRGVIHRDIKPDNIVISEEGTVKVTDFGIARIEGSDLVKTKDETFMGTIYYCSPEQFKGFSKVDNRTDIFSLGVVLYQLATGRLPFTGATPWEIMTNIITSDPISPRTVNPDLPARLDRVVLKALAKRPGDRFQTAREFKVALEDVLAEVEPRPAKPKLAERAAEMPSPVEMPTPIEMPTPVPMTIRERPVRQWLSFPIVIGLILFVAVFLLGYLSIEAEMKILQKNASIRSKNIAQMLNVLMADPSIGRNYRVLQNYTNQIGTDRDIYSIEIIKGSQLIAGYHGEHATGEQDVLMISYPLLTGEKEGGVIKVGFLKGIVQKRVSRIKGFTAVGLGAILCFIFGYLFFSRSRPYGRGY